jgi:hypothetical protein
MEKPGEKKSQEQGRNNHNDGPDSLRPEEHGDPHQDKNGRPPFPGKLPSSRQYPEISQQGKNADLKTQYPPE